jgi:hypothetical protein
MLSKYFTLISSFPHIFSDFFQSFSSSGMVHSRLIFALFLMLLALVPNLNVLTVSFILSKLGEQVMTSVVFEFPPSDSVSILRENSTNKDGIYLVSFESLYGMNLDLPSVKELITFPNADKL